MTGKICSKCEKPLSPRYWLHIFYDDGREEKRKCGELTGREGPHVALWFDFRCTKGWKGKIKQEIGIAKEPSVDHATGLYMLDDMKIVRRGKRILMVMPKNMVAVV